MTFSGVGLRRLARHLQSSRSHPSHARGENHEVFERTHRHLRPSVTLAAGFLAPVYAQAVGAQAVGDQSNEQVRQDAQADAKQDRKADKAQAHADKEEHKALKSSKVKKAARSQDKANDEAAKTPDR